ncbi:energy transducer TonB [Niastella sp. OAS944]|uniref:energy transducer TonB n=1 Tax=Niastella sp. OAS944 TaxID=2664089 RepID=UPI00349A1D29|nr:protein TonB [Chitinophagaceae bacterium OAS944]
MKPTTVLFTVILLVTACNTKDKRETYIPDDVLPEIPLKKEDTALAPTPAHKETDSIKTVKVKYTSPYVRKLVKKAEAPECGGVFMPAPEKDHSDTMVFHKVEIEAEYPGGPAAWQRFLNKNLRYPQELLDNDILTCSAVVKFVVNRDGNVSNIEAVSGPELFSAEAVRVIKKSGKWMPAVQGGRQVRSLKKQPFMIHLEAKE